MGVIDRGCGVSTHSKVLSKHHQHPIRLIATPRSCVTSDNLSEHSERKTLNRKIKSSSSTTHQSWEGKKLQILKGEWWVKNWTFSTSRKNLEVIVRNLKSDEASSSNTSMFTYSLSQVPSSLSPSTSPAAASPSLAEDDRRNTRSMWNPQHDVALIGVILVPKVD